MKSTLAALGGVYCSWKYQGQITLSRRSFCAVQLPIDVYRSASEPVVP
jgi:hypothetical protein